MSTVGTWAWAEATNGRLRRRDRAELLRQGVVAQLERVATLRGTPAPGLSLELPEPPDSALARIADEQARELSTPRLYAHCARTWAFAAMFATAERTAHDPELLYLACILHDLGLTETHDGTEAAAECFAVEGARAAHALMREHEAPPERARRVAEAITLHLNVTVPASLGAEAYLLSKGVSLDTVGRRVHALPASSVQRVDAGWPRDGFADTLAAATARQAQRRPRSRAAFLQRLGFAAMLRTNPLAMGG